MEKKKTLGVNSFGLVKELPERLEETLQELRKMGITSLEPDLIAIDRNRTLQRWLSELEAKVPGRNITPKNVWTLDQTEGYLPVIKEAGLGVFACHLFHVMMHPGALKDMVCSPGGTTIEGLAALEENNFRGAIIKACDANFQKNKLLK